MENQFAVENNINEYVKYYSRRILNDPKFYELDEAYKYEAVATFQKYFDIEASELPSMLERALSDAKNLVQSGQYFPKKMLIKFANEDANFVRKLLKSFLTGYGSTSQRIDSFISEIHNKFPLNDKQYYIDARFLSFFLSAYQPKEYFYVKPSEYKNFATMIGCDLKLRGSQGERYQMMAELASITKGILENNSDFIKVHKMITGNFEYKDPSMSWGTFDFIFDVARREGGQLDHVKKKIVWQTKVANAKIESEEEFLAGEELDGEFVNKAMADILKEANEYKAKSGSGYKYHTGTYKTRIDNARQKIRVKILENYVCQVCGFSFKFKNSSGEIKSYAEADHIIEKSDGGTEEIGNLWVLCANCHMKKTLGVIAVDPIKKIVIENGLVINIRDNHLVWNK